MYAPSAPSVNPTASTQGHFVLSPVLLASRDQDGYLLNSKIDIYDLTEKNSVFLLMFSHLSVEFFHKRGCELILSTYEASGLRKKK